MIYIAAHFIDAKDGRPADEAPLRHGPALPAPGIEIDAVDRRRQPAVILGSIPDEAEIPRGATRLSQAEYLSWLDDYRAWRAERDAEAVSRTKTDMRRQVNALRDEKLSRYRHDFGGSYGPLSLQLRDSDDRTNWLTLDFACSKLIAGGGGESPVEVRTEENVTVQMTASQASGMIAAMAGYGQEVMKASWQIKDAIEQASDPAEIDVELGWPQ
jgi:hypothetical protein